MINLINDTGFKEYAFQDTKDNFRRNRYTEATEVVEILSEKNTESHVYTSIYNYNHGDFKSSTDVTDADVIFDRLVFDFDVKETEEHILLHNGFNSVELNEMTSEDIEKEVSKIKEKETEELKKCKNDKDTQEYYIKKYEQNYLIDAYNDCLKVANFFIDNFDVEPVILFSGNKGNHCYILLNTPIAIKNVDRLVERIGDTFKTEFNIATIDENVYSSARNRLIRLPCSQHQTTKLYNTQISLSTTYDDMIINSTEQQDISKLTIPDNDTSKLEAWLIEFDNTITNELENREIYEEINNNDEYNLNSDVDIFNNTEFRKNFLKVYKTGSMNTIGYSFTHLCYRCNIAKSDVVKFFKNLEVEQDFKKVKAWIDRTYNLDININRVGGLNNFLKEVSLSATPTESNNLIKYFKSVFSKKDKIETETLTPFTIKNKGNEYPVTATIVNGDYTEIRIENLITNGLDFILNLKENNAVFRVDDIDYDFKYKYSNTSFELKPKKELEEVFKTINEDLSITLDKHFVYSLKTYFKRLYKKIQTTNQVEYKTSLIYAVKESPTNTKLLIELAEFLEKELNIQKVNGECYFIESNPKKYSNPTTDILTPEKLGYLLLNKYGLRLVEDNINIILKSIHGDDVINTSRWELANNYYLETSPEYKIVKYDDPVVCNKKLYLEMDNKKYFFEYKPQTKSLNEWNDATLTEQTLRQILIPKTKSTDTSRYIDFLQKTGATLIENNIHKTINVYYEPQGNAGKTILNYLHKLLFKSDFVGFEPQDLKKDVFATGRIANKHSIWADELTKGSLKGVWDTVKRFSSGLNNVNPRIMYSQDTDTEANFGMLFLNSNVIPQIPVNDRATLERVDIITPPNRFTSYPVAENEYEIDVWLKDKLQTDFKGLEWLINASIQEYMKMEGTFECKQTWKKTLSIIKETDEYLEFIIDCTKISYLKETDTNELLANFKNFCEENNIVNDEADLRIKQELGTSLAEVYGDELIKNDKERPVTYNIEILSKKEIAEKNNKEIMIDEEIIPESYRFNSPIQKTVYDFIKEGKANTISELKKEFSTQNITEILKHLKKEELIIF